MSILRWLLAAAVAVAVISIYVSYLNTDTIRAELKKNDCHKGVIREIVTSGSCKHIKLDAIKEDGEEVTMDIEAEDYDSSQIREGDVIYA